MLLGSGHLYLGSFLASQMVSVSRQETEAQDPVKKNRRLKTFDHRIEKHDGHARYGPKSCQPRQSGLVDVWTARIPASTGDRTYPQTDHRNYEYQSTRDGQGKYAAMRWDVRKTSSNGRSHGYRPRHQLTRKWSLLP